MSQEKKQITDSDDLSGANVSQGVELGEEELSQISGGVSTSEIVITKTTDKSS